LTFFLVVTGSTADIDNDIAFFQASLLHHPRSHPVYITCLHGLLIARRKRNERSEPKEDLDKQILLCTEAILFPPHSDGLNIVELLTDLASALLFRSGRFSQPEDVKHSIKYLRYLRGLPLDSFDVSRAYVTTALVQALSLQAVNEAEDWTSDWTRNVVEMVALCRELLANSADFPHIAFGALGDAITTAPLRDRPIQLLNQAIECLRDAVKVCQRPPVAPGSYDVLFALAYALYTRYKETHTIDDYEDAKALLERILDHNHPGESLDSVQHKASALSAMFALARSSFFANPGYSEESISLQRAFLGSLDSSFIDQGLRYWVSQTLAGQATKRSTDYGLAESLKEANFHTSQVVDLVSSPSVSDFRELAVESDIFRETYSTMAIEQQIQHLKQLLSNTPPGTTDHEQYLRELAIWYKTKFSRTNNTPDVEEAIKYYRWHLDTIHSGDLRSVLFHADLLNTIDLAFKHTNEPKYLDESIDLSRDILKMKCTGDIQYNVTAQLLASLLARSQLPGQRGDMNEVIQLIPSAVNNPHAREPGRFQFACAWAGLARLEQHPSVLTAYNTAMSLIQRTLSFAPTVSIQHTRLVAMGEIFQTMPLDYASYQIDSGRFEEAVETLEQGRTLLWSQMRGFRTSMVQLISEDPLLAKRFAEINQELEALTTSVTPSGKPEIEGDGTDPFGQLVVKQQKLLKERDVLILQIQCQPGLEGFLKTPSFTALHSAASHGPVILINHCKWRSDILILSRNSRPCSISTTNDFYTRANKLRDELVEARKRGLDSEEYEVALSLVLKGLYELVGEPVIEQLQLLGVPEQSRIWWCPSSVFCSLPLHAMGPIPSNEISGERYFLDLYIPSYTPSLSALIESQKETPQMLDKPSLLLVAQPDHSLPGVKGEIKVIQRLEKQVMVTSLISTEATPSSVLEGLQRNQFVHFACHGMLETGKPFEASFHLHGNSDLMLLEIVQSRLPDAEFAFLSCCHAAELTEGSVVDEALHLAAAMQYCGFRSVVGTMWEMADRDGRDLAKSFYAFLFSSPEGGVPYYERTAQALRDATQMMRAKRDITLERWVNFVHYGA